MFTEEATAEDVQDLLLDHEESPRNRGRLADATHAASRRHPLCGDEIAVAVRVAQDRAAAVRWEGRGCVLCRAAASLLCEAAEGRSVEDLLTWGDGWAVDRLGLPLSPAKRACASLAAVALGAALRIRKHSGPRDEKAAGSSCGPGQ